MNFESLDKLLKEMKKAVQPFATDGSGGDAAATDDSSEAGAAASAGGKRSGGGALGAIQSGDDVIKQIDLICAYYAQNEPSSPVPLILNRAKKLVNKDFTAIMSDLTPDAVSQLQVITGKKEE